MKHTRSLISRLLLTASAALLASGGVAHALAYAKASTIAEHSTLPRFFTAAFKGLWLSDALSSMVLPLILAAIALRPPLPTRPRILLQPPRPTPWAAAIFLP